MPHAFVSRMSAPQFSFFHALNVISLHPAVLAFACMSAAKYSRVCFAFALLSMSCGGGCAFSAARVWRRIMPVVLVAGSTFWSGLVRKMDII